MSNVQSKKLSGWLHYVRKPQHNGGAKLFGELRPTRRVLRSWRWWWLWGALGGSQKERVLFRDFQRGCLCLCLINICFLFIVLVSLGMSWRWYIDLFLFYTLMVGFCQIQLPITESRADEVKPILQYYYTLATDNNPAKQRERIAEDVLSRPFQWNNFQSEQLWC